MLAAVLGAVRTHCGGWRGLVHDLGEAMRECGPADRAEVMLSLCALGQLATAWRQFPFGADDLGPAIDALPDAEWQQLSARQSSRRTKKPD